MNIDKCPTTSHKLKAALKSSKLPWRYFTKRVKGKRKDKQPRTPVKNLLDRFTQVIAQQTEVIKHRLEAGVLFLPVFVVRCRCRSAGFSFTGLSVVEGDAGGYPLVFTSFVGLEIGAGVRVSLELISSVEVEPRPVVVAIGEALFRIFQLHRALRTIPLSPHYADHHLFRNRPFSIARSRSLVPNHLFPITYFQSPVSHLVVLCRLERLNSRLSEPRSTDCKNALPLSSRKF